MSTPVRLLLTITVLLSVLVVTSVPVFAQRRGGGPPSPTGPTPRSADGKPDLRGVWSGSSGRFTHSALIEEHAGGFGVTAGESLIIDPPDGVIPYRPASLAERARRRDEVNAYETEADQGPIGSTQERPEPIRREEPKVGRNDPCPCGSGKKYKKCCGLGG